MQLELGGIEQPESITKKLARFRGMSMYAVDAGDAAMTDAEVYESVQKSLNAYVEAGLCEDFLEAKASMTREEYAWESMFSYLFPLLRYHDRGEFSVFSKKRASVR